MRKLLLLAGVATVGLMLAACAQPEETPASSPARTPPATSASTLAPTPSPVPSPPPRAATAPVEDARGAVASPAPVATETPSPQPLPTATPVPTAAPTSTHLPLSAATSPSPSPNPAPRDVALSPAPTPAPDNTHAPEVSSASTPPPLVAPTATASPAAPAGAAGEASGGFRWLPPPTCRADGPTSLSFSPVDPSRVTVFEPLGKMEGDHVTPVDHTYISHDMAPQPGSTGAGGPWVSPYDVLAPADGLITKIEAFPFRPAPSGFTGVVEDYRDIIWHSCTLSTIFIHLGGLAPEILDQTGEIPSGGRWFASQSSPIEVTAGQVIGKVGLRSIDFSLHDTSVTLPGLLVPEHYAGEPWKVHTVDPFDYLDEPARSRLLEKNPRSVEPLGGKIDYDVEGRLVGTWFLDGTVGYRGVGAEPPFYVSGHLTFAYDYIDPDQLRVSIGAKTGIDEGNCAVCSGVYGVRGNGPDPATVAVESGLVKYELLGRSHTGEFHVRTANDERAFLGVMLAQVIDDRTIKVEVVPGATANEVDAFSDAARLYLR